MLCTASPFRSRVGTLETPATPPADSRAPPNAPSQAPDLLLLLPAPLPPPPVPSSLRSRIFSTSRQVATPVCLVRICAAHSTARVIQKTNKDERKMRTHRLELPHSRPPAHLAGVGCTRQVTQRNYNTLADRITSHLVGPNQETLVAARRASLEHATPQQLPPPRPTMEPSYLTHALQPQNMCNTTAASGDAYLARRDDVRIAGLCETRPFGLKTRPLTWHN